MNALSGIGIGGVCNGIPSDEHKRRQRRSMQLIFGSATGTMGIVRIGKCESEVVPDPDGPLPLTDSQKISDATSKMATNRLSIDGPLCNAVIWAHFDTHVSAERYASIVYSLVKWSSKFTVGITQDPYWRFLFCSGSNNMTAYNDLGFDRMFVLTCEKGFYIAGLEQCLIEYSQASDELKFMCANMRGGGGGCVRPHAVTYAYVVVKD